MDKYEEIAKGLKKLLSKVYTTTAGIVKEVNEQKRTCRVEIDTNVVLSNVRLKSVIDNDENGIIIFPTVGSDVIISHIENSQTEAFISSYSKFDKMLIDKGSFGGLVKVNELRDELNKVNIILQAIIDTITTPMVVPSQPPNAPDVLWVALKSVLADKLLPD